MSEVGVQWPITEYGLGRLRRLDPSGVVEHARFLGIKGLNRRELTARLKASKDKHS